MTVVYIDSVFALNALIDYLLVLSAGRLAGVPLRRKRYLMASLLGGGYAAAVFLPGCEFLSVGPVKLAAGALLALAAFGGEDHLLRLTVLLFAVSCAMAGCVLALGFLTNSAIPVIHGIFYTDVDAKVLVLSAAASYCVLTVVFRAAARHGVRGELLSARVSLGGRTVCLTALLDTGSGLREMVGGRPVLVVSPGTLDSLFPKEVRKLFAEKGLADPAAVLEEVLRLSPELKPHLLPYHAVGVRYGLLLALRTDWVEIGGKRYPGLTAALSPTALGDGYSALWGGERERADQSGKEGTHENTTGKSLAAAGTAGLHPAGDGAALHRRKRHAASAAEPGAGGGTAGPSGQRGVPEGAD